MKTWRGDSVLGVPAWLEMKLNSLDIIWPFRGAVEDTEDGDTCTSGDASLGNCPQLKQNFTCTKLQLFPGWVFPMIGSSLPLLIVIVSVLSVYSHPTANSWNRGFTT